MQRPYTFMKSFLASFALIIIFVTQANSVGVDAPDSIDVNVDDGLVYTSGASGDTLMLN